MMPFRIKHNKLNDVATVLHIDTSKIIPSFLLAYSDGKMEWLDNDAFEDFWSFYGVETVAITGHVNTEI